MSFQFEKLKAHPAFVTAKDRLYRTNDGRLVGEDDPAAAFLFCAPGQIIPIEEAVKYGLVDGDSLPETQPGEELGKKESRPTATKESRPKETKSKQ